MKAVLPCTFLVLFGFTDFAPTLKYPRAELLIEPATLATWDPAKPLRILDARGSSKYEEGHISGAVRVDATAWARDFARQQDPRAWAKRLGDLGIDPDVPVVVYDDALAKDAARVWWILKYWGVRDVRLLNGGWKGWTSSGGKAVVEPSKVTPTSPQLKPQPQRLATKEQMVAFARGKDRQIVDARSLGEFCGEEETAKRNGAIPNAIHREWSDLLDKTTQRFKAPDELAKLLRSDGIDPDRPSVTYCQSGGRAAVMAFALELMGGKDVRNYYRSWSEWGNAADTPVAKPARPK